MQHLLGAQRPPPWAAAQVFSDGDPEPDPYSSLPVTFLVFGSFLVLQALTSKLWKDRLCISPPILATLFGVAFGPLGLNCLSLGSGWIEGVESDSSRAGLQWLCRVVLGSQVLSGAITLPSKLLLRPRVAVSLFTLLLPQIGIAWLVSAAAAYFVFPKMAWEQALVVGSCLGPTDPVLASSVIKGEFSEKHVPQRIRNLLLSESIINDGAGTPFVYLALLLFTRKSSSAPSPPFLKLAVEGRESVPAVLLTLLTHTILWNVVVGAVLGVVLGWGCRIFLKKSRTNEWINKENNLVLTLALATSVIGFARVLKVNELLACFTAGTALNWDDYFHQDDLNTHFSEGIDNLLDMSVFTFLGTTLPFKVWHYSEDLPWGRLVLLAFLIITLRRLPGVLLLKKAIPVVKNWKETAFVGWFGPMGVAAIYYSLESLEELPESSFCHDNLFPIISWIVVVSVVVHGVTIPILMALLTGAPSLAPHLLPNGNENGEIEHSGRLGENSQSNDEECSLHHESRAHEEEQDATQRNKRNQND